MPSRLVHLLGSRAGRSLAACALLVGASGPPRSSDRAGTGAEQRREHRMPVTPPPAVPREFRAAWATPIEDRGLHEWPSVPGLSPDSQRAEMRAMLDHAAAVGLNAVVLHVRLAGDAFYRTTFAPWSAFLTGRSGRAPQPAYDPLAYAIDQAHARGLQLHAWFNPFRAMLPAFAGKAAASHVTRRHPAWIRHYGKQTWIDPGDPAARTHVLRAMLDVVRRYDVDGIQIDDYFYPYQETRVVVRRVGRRRVRRRVPIAFPDSRTWTRYGRAKGYTDRAAWRRANIDDFVRTLYREVKALKPAVLVGISPFGIWRSGSPAGVTGLDAYSELYADSRRWLAEGWLDYIAPQLYWPLDGAQNRFRALAAWWRSENTHERHVWPGLYTAKIQGGGDAWPLGEIRAEIDALRGTWPPADGAGDGAGDAGHIHFRLSALFADDDRLAHDLAATYGDPALVPASPWLVSAVPAAPQVAIAEGDGPSALTVAPGDTVQVRWWLVQTRDTSGVWSTALRPAGAGRLAAPAAAPETVDEIAVTAIGLAGVAGPPAILVP